MKTHIKTKRTVDLVAILIPKAQAEINQTPTDNQTQLIETGHLQRINRTRKTETVDTEKCT